MYKEASFSTPSWLESTVMRMERTRSRGGKGMNGERGEKAGEILGVQDYVNWPGSHSNCGKDAFSRQVGRCRKVSRDST